MTLPKVIVKDIPVRYENETYRKGETFEMKAAHVVESLVSVVEESKKAPKKSKE